MPNAILFSPVLTLRPLLVLLTVLAMLVASIMVASCASTPEPDVVFAGLHTLCETKARDAERREHCVRAVAAAKAAVGELLAEPPPEPAPPPPRLVAADAG